MVLRYIRSGKPVFGGSAKAITLGKYIGTSSFGGEADENTVGFNDLRSPDVAREYAARVTITGQPVTYLRLSALRVPWLQSLHSATVHEFR